MPPRFAYWTILIDNLPTAFRARDREELLPTLTQLKRKNQSAVLRWFAQGRLWDSPEAQRASWADRKPAAEQRDRDWRPGGDHKDPRARFDKEAQRRKKREQRAAWNAQPRPPRSSAPGGAPARRDREKLGPPPVGRGPANHPRREGEWRGQPGNPPRGDSRPWSNRPPRDRKPGGADWKTQPPRDRPAGGGGWNNRPPRDRQPGGGGWKDRPPRDREARGGWKSGAGRDGRQSGAGRDGRQSGAGRDARWTPKRPPGGAPPKPWQQRPPGPPRDGGWKGKPRSGPSAPPGSGWRAKQPPDERRRRRDDEPDRD